VLLSGGADCGDVPGEGLCQKLVVEMAESLCGHRARVGGGALPTSAEHPTQTPETLATAIVQLRQTSSLGGWGPVRVDGMREHLRQHGGDAIPSRRTISRMRKRQVQEVTAHGFPS